MKTNQELTDIEKELKIKLKKQKDIIKNQSREKKELEEQQSSRIQ